MFKDVRSFGQTRQAFLLLTTDGKGQLVRLTRARSKYKQRITRDGRWFAVLLVDELRITNCEDNSYDNDNDISNDSNGDNNYR